MAWIKSSIYVFNIFYHCLVVMNTEILAKIYGLLFYDGQLAVIFFFILSGAVTYLSMDFRWGVYYSPIIILTVYVFHF